jgi:hypothetical protein
MYCMPYICQSLGVFKALEFSESIHRFERFELPISPKVLDMCFSTSKSQKIKNVENTISYLFFHDDHISYMYGIMQYPCRLVDVFGAEEEKYH